MPPTRRSPAAMAARSNSLSVSPMRDANLSRYVGQIKVFLGRANEAAEHTLKAIQLSPRDPQLAEWYYQLAITYIHQQRYDEAVEWARRGVEVNPNLRYPYRVLAAALALSGRALQMVGQIWKPIDTRLDVQLPLLAQPCMRSLQPRSRHDHPNRSAGGS